MKWSKKELEDELKMWRNLASMLKLKKEKNTPVPSTPPVTRENSTDLSNKPKVISTAAPSRKTVTTGVPQPCPALNKLPATVPSHQLRREAIHKPNKL